MSEQNVEIVRGLVESQVATGVPLWNVVDEGVTVYDHQRAEADEYDGHEGYARWFDRVKARWPQYTADIEYIDAGEAVVVVLAIDGTGPSGVPVRRDEAMVCSIDHKMVVRVEYFGSPSEALKAVGLAE